ncbi:MAG: hypothetical protein Tsb002_10960 [Wenzhouxiangellaceae bacterium]
MLAIALMVLGWREPLSSATIFQGDLNPVAGPSSEAKSLTAKGLLVDWRGHWREADDQGDDPLVAGCACQYEQPMCGGELSGRAVDECYPPDHNQLREMVMTAGCDHFEEKRYDCADLLGEGASCQLQPMVCCGIATLSAYCAPPAANELPAAVLSDEDG